MKKRSGQVALYLIMVIFVIFLLTLMNVDVFMAVRGKTRLQNAGDAAALAAARRQGELLNEIGRLNIDHIIAVLDNKIEDTVRIEQAQREVALLGPIDALAKSDELAKANGAKPRDEFSELIRRHAHDVLSLYNGGDSYGEPFPESYPGAWQDYANRLYAVADNSLAAGPDNFDFYGADGSHYLMNRQFYFAIAAKNWCWFHFGRMGLLQNYSGWTSWAPLPGRKEGDDSFADTKCINGEIFSLHLKTVRESLKNLFTINEINELLRRYAGGTRQIFAEDELKNNELYFNTNQVWFVYDETEWSRWFDSDASLSGEDDDPFPIVGTIKDEYNVNGCAAVCRCYGDTFSVATESSTMLEWTSAAKPFGTVESFSGDSRLVTSLNNFVVPCFSDVRMIPVDSAPGSEYNSSDYYWVVHLRDHLGSYMQEGKTAANCFYCTQLASWEKPSFRQTGLTWLKFNSSSCIRSTGGSIRQGGTSRGH